MFNQFKHIFQNDIGIDLGTMNTLVWVAGEGIVLEEPSYVAINADNNKVRAVGRDAKKLHSMTSERIRVVRPMRDGVIADAEVTDEMLRIFIRKATGHFKVMQPRVLVAVPSGITEVGVRAVMESAMRAGARAVRLVEEPFASALGVGLPVEEPDGNMIVDIGGGTTEIAVISLGGIVESSSIHIAGNEITTDIIDYLGQQHNISIGRTTAEKIKFAVGAVLPELPPEEEPENFIVEGKNLVTAHPATASISYKEISSCIDKTITKIESEIIKVLQSTPPELYSNIVKNGIWLAGGGSLLRGIAQRFTDRVNIQFHVAEDPLKAVARGTCLALKGTESYPFLMR